MEVRNKILIIIVVLCLSLLLGLGLVRLNRWNTQRLDRNRVEFQRKLDQCSAAGGSPREWGRLWRTQCRTCQAELVTPGTLAGHIHELVLDGWRPSIGDTWVCDACIQEASE